MVDNWNDLKERRQEERDLEAVLSPASLANADSPNRHFPADCFEAAPDGRADPSRPTAPAQRHRRADPVAEVADPESEIPGAADRT
jgi:hypothetical protein